MCGSGKGLQQTSQTMALPTFAAMGAYNTAMDRIAQATSQPFQKYSSRGEDYVASLTPTQRSAISNVTGMKGMTDPYFKEATGLTREGAAPVGRLTGEQIGEYMSPYMSQVIDPVTAALKQQQGQQLSQQQTEAIRGGAFGGERAGLQRAMLMGQQNLGLGQALSPLYQQGYGQALQTALGQQGVEAANLQRLLGAGAQIGGLGTAAQNAALQQASAQLQGGTLEQQTATAQKQALYNEFQKQRMYPLQVAQMYAQAAGSLGPLMGSMSQGYQQMPFFGGLAAHGGAIHGYDEGLGKARMGGAVVDLEPGKDYWRGGYADGGDAGFSDIVAQQRAALGLGQPQQDIAFPTVDIKASRPLEANLPERQQTGGLGSLLTKGAELGKKGFDIREKLNKLPESASILDKASAFFADGGSVDEDAMSDLLNNPIKTAQPMQAQQASQKQGSGLLGGLLKAGASMAANYFLPGSGALVSAGLGAAGMAEGGRAGYADGGGDDMDAYLRPLARIETGGERDPYSALGPMTKYGRALGKYQIMEGNVPEWTKAALGRAMTKDEFLGNREAQEATARHRFGQYLDKAGTPEGAAAMWFGGPGYAKHMGARDVLGTSIPQYMAKYKAGLGEPDLSKLGPRERSMMALYPDRPTTEAPGPSAGLGSAQVKDKGFMERTQEHPESLILPVLQGLGAMAGSKNRYALGAMMEGIGAGAGSYMDMQSKQAEIDKMRQEAAREGEYTRYIGEQATKLGGVDTEKVRADTAAVYAGLMQVIPAPGVGVFVLDKAHPEKGLIKVADAEGRPVPGQEHLAEAAKSMPGGGGDQIPQDVTRKVRPETQAPATGGVPTTKPAEAPHPWEWKATTEPPKDYVVPDAMMTALTPGARETAMASGEKEASEARQNNASASRQLTRIAEMQENANKMKDSFFQLGKSAPQRLEIAKSINDLTQLIAGRNAFDPAQVAAGEVMAKDTFRLGSAAAGALEGRPAQAIIQESVVATPSLANTKMGYMRLLAGLKAAAEYEQARSYFINSYNNKFKTTAAAQQEFDRLNPPWRFAQKAVASTIAPEHLGALKQYGMNIKNQIDKIYGAGTTQLLMEGNQ